MLVGVCALPSEGQLLDTLSASFRKIPMPFFSFESNNSFVGKTPAWVTGYKVGVTFNSRISFGYGWYKLVSDIVENKKVQSESGHDTIVPAQLEMKYKGISMSYVYLKNNKWVLSASLQPGWGKSYFEYFESRGNAARAFEHNVVMLEFGSGAQYKIVRWVGVGAGIGYRVMLKNNPSFDYNFNTLNYYLGIRIYIDEIYKTVFPKGIRL